MRQTRSSNCSTTRPSRSADPGDRITFRDPIVSHGAPAIDAMADGSPTRSLAPSLSGSSNGSVPSDSDRKLWSPSNGEEKLALTR